MNDNNCVIVFYQQTPRAPVGSPLRLRAERTGGEGRSHDEAVEAFSCRRKPPSVPRVRPHLL